MIKTLVYLQYKSCTELNQAHYEAEDLLLLKLLWNKIGPPQQQMVFVGYCIEGLESMLSLPDIYSVVVLM